MCINFDNDSVKSLQKLKDEQKTVFQIEREEAHEFHQALIFTEVFKKKFKFSDFDFSIAIPE
jgi:hypothetical protein